MTFKKNLIILLLAISCIACEKSSTETNSTAENNTAINNGQLPPSLHINEAAANRVADKLWKKSQQQLSTTLTKATSLQQAIEKLLEKPTTKSLQAAQQEWRATIIAYQQLSPLLYLDTKKVDLNKTSTEKDTEKPQPKTKVVSPLSSIHHWRNRIAAWPIQPGFIDSFGDYIHSGIVNDISLSIDAHTLRGQHLLTHDQEVTLGLYTIEYLLFGDRDYKGKKNIAYKRFVKITKLPERFAKAGVAVHELHNNRRRSLITLQTRLLINDIQTLIGLYQSSGALSLAFQELTTLEKLQAFQNSTSQSLQHIDKLLAFYQEELQTNSTEKPEDKNTKEQSVFSKRFYKNTKLALKNNLITISSLYPSNDNDSKDDSKNAQDFSLSSALFSGRSKESVLQLIKSLEQEISKKESNIEKITLITRQLSRALQL